MFERSDGQQSIKTYASFITCNHNCHLSLLGRSLLLYEKAHCLVLCILSGRIRHHQTSPSILNARHASQTGTYSFLICQHSHHPFISPRNELERLYKCLTPTTFPHRHSTPTWWPTDDFHWVANILSHAVHLPKPFPPFCCILIVVQCHHRITKPTHKTVYWCGGGMTAGQWDPTVTFPLTILQECVTPPMYGFPLIGRQWWGNVQWPWLAITGVVEWWTVGHVTSARGGGRT